MFMVRDGEMVGFALKVKAFRIGALASPIRTH